MCNPKTIISAPAILLMMWRWDNKNCPRKVAEAPSRTKTNVNPAEKKQEFMRSNFLTFHLSCLALVISSKESPETMER